MLVFCPRALRLDVRIWVKMPMRPSAVTVVPAIASGCARPPVSRQPASAAPQAGSTTTRWSSMKRRQATPRQRARNFGLHGFHAASSALTPGITEGDVHARLRLLVDQTRVSLSLVEACAEELEHLPPGPISVKLPKVLRAPEGHTHVWTENASGINGYLLVSRGERTPWRLKLRSASFNTIAAVPDVLPGTPLAKVLVAVASLFYVVGDVDR